MNHNKSNSDKNPKVLVCIPAYNEARSVGLVVEKAKNHSTEVIVCDDGSYDDTTNVARMAGATVIRHTKNQGYGKTIRTLFQAALERDADIVVTLDSDGQHSADQIPKIIEPILMEDFDIVIGSRFMDYKDKTKVPFYRSVGIKTITKITNRASYRNLTDSQSGFRGYSRRALEKIRLVEDGMRISTEILLRARTHNLTIKEVPITISYDVENGSTHNFLSHGLSVLFSVIQFISLRHPLLFYGLPGVGLLVVSGIFAHSALEFFSSSRYVTAQLTNILFVTIGSAIIGIVLLTTGSMLFSIAAMLKGRIRLDF